MQQQGHQPESPPTSQIQVIPPAEDMAIQPISSIEIQQAFDVPPKKSKPQKHRYKRFQTHDAPSRSKAYQQISQNQMSYKDTRPNDLQLRNTFKIGDEYEYDQD